MEKRDEARIEKLADVVVNYSISCRRKGWVYFKKGDTVEIVGDSAAEELIKQIYKKVLQKGGYPYVLVGLPGMSKIYYENASDEQLKHFPDLSMHVAKKATAYVYIYAPHDTKELKDIKPEKLALRQQTVKSIGNYIVNTHNKIRRVSLNFPTLALAKDANMSLDDYKDFLFNATNIDWKKQMAKMEKIHKLFENGRKVRIEGKGTDITLGIKGRKFVIDAGEENMPGGEMFAAPLETETNGYILFTYPSKRDGREISEIYLEFDNGKVIKARAKTNNDYLQKMLKLKGARIVGELGIGCNYRVDRFTNELLFDEKIGGTIHLALGMSYKECKGKNSDAAIHWDIVKDLRKQAGGGKIYVDGKLIQKDGKWIF